MSAAAPTTGRTVPMCPISRDRARASTLAGAPGSMPALKCCPATANSPITRFRRRSGTHRSDLNVSYQQGPRTRIYVSRRSWLDAGVEVLPGDRKFTDYAFPTPFGYPSFARENNNRPIDRQPLNPPSDLGGEPTKFPLY